MTSAEPVPIGNHYDKAATKHSLERRMVDGFAAELASLIPEDPRRVLDVGCGEGHHMQSIADARPKAVLNGIDVADPAWLAQWHPKGGVASSDAAALPFASEAFDLVLALEVLEHVTEPRAVLAEIARVGHDRVILSVPWEPVWRAGNLVRGRYVTALGNTPGHLQHFTRRGFLRLVGEYFEVEAVRRPVPWTLVRARARPPR
jgi:ubiquinone/menaquinone biosynthesis C-methylase UbiE